MKTHQLATLLDGLRAGFGDGMKANVANEFQQAAAALRELPDEPLRELLNKARAKPPGEAQPARGIQAKVAPEPAQVIGAIELARAGQGVAAALHSDIAKLTADGLKTILRHFQGKTSGGKAELAERVRGLLSAPTPPVVVPTAPVGDQAAIDQGYHTYARLRDDRTLSVNDVRAEFQPVRSYPKPVLEAILRRIDFTPSGTRDDMADRLLSTLLDIKRGQMREEIILTGV